MRLAVSPTLLTGLTIERMKTMLDTITTANISSAAATIIIAITASCSSITLSETMNLTAPAISPFE